MTDKFNLTDKAPSDTKVSDNDWHLTPTIKQDNTSPKYRITYQSMKNETILLFAADPHDCAHIVFMLTKLGADEVVVVRNNVRKDPA
jgi:hypothetical protein